MTGKRQVHRHLTPQESWENTYFGKSFPKPFFFSTAEGKHCSCYAEHREKWFPHDEQKMLKNENIKKTPTGRLPKNVTRETLKLQKEATL